MAKKDFNFFSAFIKQMVLCKKAASQLVDMMSNYTNVSSQADAIHNTEHEADKALHELMDQLNRSFITPIDREDIVALAAVLDNITDSIEDVANLFDMLSIDVVKPEAIDMAKLILAGCEALCKAVEEFGNFKKSNELSELLIKVNAAEENGDKMHRAIIKRLYLEETNAITIMRWKEIFDVMEDVLDYCEDAADVIDGLVIKNS